MEDNEKMLFVDLLTSILAELYVTFPQTEEHKAKANKVRIAILLLLKKKFGDDDGDAFTELINRPLSTN